VWPPPPSRPAVELRLLPVELHLIPVAASRRFSRSMVGRRIACRKLRAAVGVAEIDAALFMA
jgi:hypothetical protein